MAWFYLIMLESTYLLATASEEAGKFVQNVGKAIRFGLNNIEPGQQMSNAQRLIIEFNHIEAMMEMMYAAKVIRRNPDVAAWQREDKTERVARYMKEHLHEL